MFKWKSLCLLSAIALSLALAPTTHAGVAPTFSECQRNWTSPADAFQSVLTGDTILHRLYQIANYTPDKSKFSPADYDSPYGRGSRSKMEKFGIEYIERSGDTISLSLKSQLRDGTQDGWMTIGEQANGAAYVVRFRLAKTGANTELTNVEGIYGHGPIPLLRWIVDSQITGFRLIALQNGYIYAHMATQFGDTDLCGTPDHGIGKK